MALRIVFILLLALSANAFSQRLGPCRGRGQVQLDSTFSISIHHSLPRFNIRLIEFTDTTREFPRNCYRILYSKEAGASYLGEVNGKSNADFDFDSYYFSESGHPNCKGLSFVDFNFDGYLDMQMLSGSSVGSMNASWDFFLFDPQKQRFVYNRQFSKLLAGNYPSINPDGTIETGGVLGCAGSCWSSETYKVVRDSLILIHEVSQESAPDGSGGLIYIEKKLINGIMTVVVQRKVTD